MFTKYFVVLFVALASVQLTKAIYVEKCKSTDKKCVKSSALALIPAFAAGIPELNVAQMDPLHIDTLDASTPDLKLLLKDITVTGLAACDFKKLERNAAKTKILAQGLCDMDFKGQYEMNGRLAVLPIEGKGDAHVQLNKVLIDFVANMGEKTDKQGVKHWDIKSFSHSYELKDTAKISLDNLFNGNKELGAAANALFTSSPNDVVKAIGGPIVKDLLTVVVKNVNHFFHRLPAEDLSID